MSALLLECDSFFFLCPAFVNQLSFCVHVFPGLCALSISNDNCYLAYPGSATIGEVQVFDTVNLVSQQQIQLHVHVLHLHPFIHVGADILLSVYSVKDPKLK